MKISDLRKKFKNEQLLDQAFTHKSWVNENPGTRQSNERLEFLGDAVLELVISDEIYNRFKDKPEGFLTALRANLVNTRNLSKVATNLNLGENLFLSKGEEETGGRNNTSLLANTVEALIGAIYMDLGQDEAKKFIQDHVLPTLEEKLKKPLKDYKSRLQEYVQSEGKPSPRYKVVNEIGPDHDKHFEVEVSVNGDSMTKGKGKSKSTAEQDAARSALAKLGIKR